MGAAAARRRGGGAGAGAAAHQRSAAPRRLSSCHSSTLPARATAFNSPALYFSTAFTVISRFCFEKSSATSAWSALSSRPRRCAISAAAPSPQSATPPSKVAIASATSAPAFAPKSTTTLSRPTSFAIGAIFDCPTA